MHPLTQGLAEWNLLLPKPKDILRENFESGEIVLYEMDRHQAMTLNPEAALIWDLCDQQVDFRTAVEKVEETFGIAPGEPIVWSALHRFQKHGLLEDEIQIPNEPAYSSRRKFLRNFGTLAASLPVVLVMSVPSPASAQSGLVTCCVTLGPTAQIATDCMNAGATGTGTSYKSPNCTGMATGSVACTSGVPNGSWCGPATVCVSGNTTCT